jgi:hypothetical protein
MRMQRDVDLLCSFVVPVPQGAFVSMHANYGSTQREEVPCASQTDHRP